MPKFGALDAPTVTALKTAAGIPALEAAIAANAALIAANAELVAQNQIITDLLVDGGLAGYTGTGPVHPLLSDVDRKVLLGFNATTGQMEGAGIVNPDDAQQIAEQAMGDAGINVYEGTGDVVPMMTDNERRVLLGYDKVNNRIVGAGLGSASSAAAVTAQALDPADVPVIKDKNGILGYGQSLVVGATATTILSITQPYSNLTFNGGPRAWTGSAADYTAFKPLVEDNVSPAPDAGVNRGETICSGAANFASTLMAVEDGIDPSTHVIFASTAGKGGTVIDDLDKGSAWYAAHFLPHVQGAFDLDSNYALHAVAWVQGENDSGITSFATYYAKETALAADIETDVKAITGQTSPVFFLTYQTRAWYNIDTGAGDTELNSDVALAQLAVAQDNPRVFMVTPIYHIPRSEGTHLTNAGYKWLGAYFGRAYKRLVIDGLKPQWLNPISATARANVIRVRFDVPVAPMTLDQVSLVPVTDYGFVVEDTTGVLTIDSVAIDDSDVVITLSTTPVGATDVRYALDYDGLSINNGKAGNLRDSAPDTITISGTVFPLYNVAPSFLLPVIVLGE